MVEIAAVIALLLFIYISRSIQKRRTGHRETRNERREEYMQRFLSAGKKNDTENKEEPDQENK